MGTMIRIKSLLLSTTVPQLFDTHEAIIKSPKYLNNSFFSFDVLASYYADIEVCFQRYCNAFFC